MADALSHVPPTVQLAYLSAPTLLDVVVIKAKVEKNLKLVEVINKLKKMLIVYLSSPGSKVH